MGKQSEFNTCLLSQIGGYRKKIHGEEFFSPSQKELFPGLKRDLNMEIEDAARSDDPLEACMERRGYKPSKTQLFQEAISAKLTADMFGKQEKLTGAEAMFQEQMQECLDKLKNRPKLKFGKGGTASEAYAQEKKPYEMTEKEWESEKNKAHPENVQTNLTKRSASEAVRKMQRSEYLNYNTPGEWNDIREGFETDHKDVILKALAENQRIPEAVLNEYPDLKRMSESEIDQLYLNQIKDKVILQYSASMKKVGNRTQELQKILDLVLPLNYTQRFKLSNFIVESGGEPLKIDNTPELQASLVKMVRYHGLINAMKNYFGKQVDFSIKKKKHTIPEQADFINPSQMTLFGAFINKYSNVSVNFLSIGDKVKYKNKMATVIETMKDHPKVIIKYDKTGKEEWAKIDKVLFQYQTEKTPKNNRQMTLFGAAPTGTENYMQDSPISKELQHRFEQTTFYPYDLNKEFNETVSASENEAIETLKKYGITEIPEDIQTALAYHRKAAYEWYVTKANQVPGPMITGPSNYKLAPLKKSIAREDKALTALELAKEHIRTGVKRAIKVKRSTIQNTSREIWKTQAITTPKREFADKVFQSTYDKAPPNLKADYDNGIFVTSIKNKGKKYHKELIEEAIREGLEIDAKVEKDYPELFGKEKPKKENAYSKATRKLTEYEKDEKAMQEHKRRQEESERTHEEWSRSANERIAEASKRIEERKSSKKTIPEQSDFINPSQMTLFGRLQNSDSLPPILGWVGGKTKLAEKIISMMPEHKVYVEPFLGGGSVFFKKPLADVNVINDLDKDLISFYKGVRDGGCEEIRACKIPKNRTEFDRAVNNESKDICNYLGVNSAAWGANMKRKTYVNRKTPRNAIKLKLNCDRYKDKLEQAKILNKDYRNVVKEYDSKDTLVYMDPPYDVIDKRLYNHNEYDPEKVANLVKSLKGKAIVSYNNHPRVRKAFAGLNFHKVKTVYSIQSGTKRNVSELLITNF
jgi:DNA adenine methylase